MTTYVDDASPRKQLCLMCQGSPSGTPRKEAPDSSVIGKGHTNIMAMLKGGEMNPMEICCSSYKYCAIITLLELLPGKLHI